MGEATSLLLPGSESSRLRACVATLHAPELVVPLSIALYMVCSASMSLVNKLVTRSFLGLEVTATEVQMLFVVVCLPTLFFNTLRVGSWRDALRWATVIPLAYAAMLTTGMLALSNATVGFVTVIRNVGPLISLPLECAAPSCPPPFRPASRHPRPHALRGHPPQCHCHHAAGASP